MGAYTITRAKDDGTYDLVKIDLKTNEENKDKFKGQIN